MAGFASELRAESDPLWQVILGHPFLHELGTGALPVDRFAWYLRQDYAYLVEYCRAIALAVASAEELGLMSRLAGLLHATLTSEMEIHRRYSAGFGVSPSDLAAVVPAPTTHAYTSHLLAVAHSGSAFRTLGALLPCQCGYLEAGRRLAGEATPAGRERYGGWIDAYASAEYAELVGWLVADFDTLAARAAPDELRHVRRLYVLGCRYEYAFWQMAYAGEEWLLAGSR